MAEVAQAPVAPAPAPAPAPSIAPEIAAKAESLGVDVSQYANLPADTVANILQTIEKSAGSMALKIMGQSAMPNSALPAQPAPAAPVQPPAMPTTIPASVSFKFDLPDPEKLGDEYGDEIRNIVRAVKERDDYYRAQIAAQQEMMGKVVPVVDSVHNAYVEDRFDQDLNDLLNGAPDLAGVYGTGPSRKVVKEHFEARQELFNATSRFGNSGMDRNLAMKMLALGVAEKRTGKQVIPSGPQRDSNGRFATPTSIAPPVRRTTDLKPAEPAKPKHEVVRETAEALERKWSQEK